MRIGMFLIFVSIAFMGCRSGNKVVDHKQNALALQKRIGAVVRSRVSEDGVCQATCRLKLLRDLYA